MASDSLRALLERSAAVVAALPRRQPEFHFEISMAPSYDALLSGQLTDPVADLDQILALARSRGRLVLSAPAGMGKSSLVGRLAGRAVDREVPTLLVDLRRWTPRVDDAWHEARGSEVRRMRILLETLAQPAVAEAELRSASAERSALVVVDGLNELPARTSSGMPATLDAFAARNPWASVVVCDRFQRRALPSSDWALATIASVSDPSTGAVSDVQNALLLDISRREDVERPSEAAILLGHLRHAAELAGEEEARLAEAAFELYSRADGRLFEWNLFEQLAGAEVADRLTRDGTLQREEEFGYFRHHLFHDALAAKATVRDQTRWSTRGFDALTFHANSFDAVGLALELITAPGDADDFVTSVYDWNLYAAAYATSRGRRLGSIAVTTATELAMLAVLGERRWDPFAPTVQRVEDALRVWPARLAPGLLSAETPEQVFGIIDQATSGDPAAREWREVFLARVSPAQLVDALGSGPLTGWMAANALRREPLGTALVERVLDASRSSEATIRWRAVHVLGAHPSKRAVKRLLEAVDRDRAKWVPYGAIRSLVEVAARSDELRESTLRQIRRRLPQLRKNRRVLGELERALELRDPPFGWAAAVEPLLAELLATSVTVPDQDHWRRVGQRVTESIRAARAAAHAPNHDAVGS